MTLPPKPLPTTSTSTSCTFTRRGYSGRPPCADSPSRPPVFLAAGLDGDRGDDSRLQARRADRRHACPRTGCSPAAAPIASRRPSGADRVDCGAGIDSSARTRATAWPSNCEIVSRRLSVDPYANDDSQHETAVEPDSPSSGRRWSPCSRWGAARQARPPISAPQCRPTPAAPGTGASCPRRPLNAAARPGDAASDPSVAFDAVHGVWLVSSLTIEPDSRTSTSSRSTDGKSWSPPVDAVGGPLLDKEWVTATTARRARSGAAATWSTPTTSELTVSQFSTDGGVTWSHAGARGLVLVGTQPVVRPDGTLVVVAGDYRGEEGSQVDGRAALDRRRRDVSRASSSPTCAPPTTTRCGRSHCRRSTSTRTGRSTPSGTTAASAPAARANDMVLSTSADGLRGPRRCGSRSRPRRRPFVLHPGLAADPAPGAARARLRYFQPARAAGAACSASASRSRATPARRGRCSSWTRSRSRRPGSRAPRAAGWSATTSRLVRRRPRRARVPARDVAASRAISAGHLRGVATGARVAPRRARAASRPRPRRS